MMGECRFPARESYRQPIGGYPKRWIGNTVLLTGVMNPSYATPDLLHQLHAIEHTKKQGVPGHALTAQVFLPHPSGKSTGRHYLHPILEDVNLHVGRTSIVAVGDGVDHGFPQGALPLLEHLELAGPGAG